MKTATLERKAASPKRMHPTQLIRRIQKGLPFAELEALRKDLDLPLDQLAGKLSISTVARVPGDYRRMSRIKLRDFHGYLSKQRTFLVISKGDAPG